MPTRRRATTKAAAAAVEESGLTWTPCGTVRCGLFATGRVAVRDFERTHGANSCSVASAAARRREQAREPTDTPKYRSSRHDWSGDNSAQVGAAYDYARTHPEEMSVWQGQ